MQTIRNLNIIILAFLMILTGCFGLADDAVTDDAEGQTTNDSTTAENTINHAPFIGDLSLIHISEPTRHAQISYAVFCLKKKNTSYLGTLA